MAKYTKEFWIEYNKKRKGASEETKQFIKEMFENKTLQRRSSNWNNFYMVTGMVLNDKDDLRRLQNYDNYTY